MLCWSVLSVYRSQIASPLLTAMVWARPASTGTGTSLLIRVRTCLLDRLTATDLMAALSAGSPRAWANVMMLTALRRACSLPLVCLMRCARRRGSELPSSARVMLAHSMRYDVSLYVIAYVPSWLEYAATRDVK